MWNCKDHGYQDTNICAECSTALECDHTIQKITEQYAVLSLENGRQKSCLVKIRHCETCGKPTEATV